VRFEPFVEVGNVGVAGKVGGKPGEQRGEVLVGDASPARQLLPCR